MGPYCKFCNRRCFLIRVIPGGADKGKSLLLATCEQGMAFDQAETGYTHETALNPVTQEDEVAALAAALRGEISEAGVQHITKRADLVALANKLGMRPDWHEPDEQEVTVCVSGTEFDNAGHWGAAEVERRKAENAKGWASGVHTLEMWVTVFRDGRPVGEVNLATLFAFATGFEG